MECIGLVIIVKTVGGLLVKSSHTNATCCDRVCKGQLFSYDGSGEGSVQQFSCQVRMWTSSLQLAQQSNMVIKLTISSV
jgi:hypothetical protein